jgi:outer membrane biosynthesis protein TonB
VLAARTRVALATALVAFGLSSCGGSDDAGLLPADDAGALLQLLDQAEQTFEDESCDELDSTLTALDGAVDGLPDADVDRRLRTTLNAEIQDLTEMAERCEPPVEVEEPAPTPAPAPVPAPPPTTVPETTPPTPVEPTTEETETEEEPPPEDEEPEEKAPKPPPEQKPPAKPPKPPPRDPCANDSPRC